MRGLGVWSQVGCFNTRGELQGDWDLGTSALGVELRTASTQYHPEQLREGVSVENTELL